MSARIRTNWVVTITDTQTGDPVTYGPWTRQRAEQIEAAMERFFAGVGDTEPLVSAYPLKRETIPALKAQWVEYKGSR